mgnify:CR=1 FL=1
MNDELIIAKNTSRDIGLLPAMANRHGLITGATGTGKTVTLQTLAEHFAAIMRTKNSPSRFGMCSANPATRCARQSRTWVLCCSRACSN